MNNKILILVTLALVFSCKENDKPQKTETQSRNNYAVEIDSFLTNLAKDQVFMGSVSISKNGEVVYSNAIGYSDLESEIKANKNTKYRIASITKVFTAVLVFKAIEDGKIQLDQTIDSFFPTLLDGDKITIAHLLHHQSGIMSYTKDQYFWDNRTQNQSSKDLMNVIISLDRNFEPGENTEYSNSNYFLLAQLLELVYDDRYENLLEKNIIKPLGLQDTYVGKTTHSDHNESFSYTSENGEWKLFPETHLSIAKGSGSLLSTPSDLNIFFRGLMKGQLISSASIEKMTTIIRNHGMGIFRYNIHDQSGYGHGGNIDGFTANSIYFMDLDVALTISSNASSMPIEEVYSEILKAYLGKQEVTISEEEVAQFVGVYISENDPEDQCVFIQDNNVLVNFIKNEFKAPLVYRGNNRFVLEQLYAESISFTFSDDGNQLIFEQGDYRGVYKKE